MDDINRPLRLLSFDGGGVRGLSSIMILQHIMAGLNETRSPEDQLRPCQIFDMMGGTSTGGIIAIMLSRLRMTLEECEDAYLKLSKQILQPKRAGFNKAGQALDLLEGAGKFDAGALESAIKEVIVGKGGSEDVLLKDQESGCKVFVCAARANNAEPALLRSYRNPKKAALLYDECKIWQACRATSAATTFFDPITFGRHSQTFIDGGIIYNNPVQLVHREAADVWPNRDLLLISIGTGSAPGKAFKGNIKKIVDSMKAILTQTERTANDFHQSHPEMVRNNLFFRFNVTHGLAEVGLEEYNEVSAIADATQTYIDTGETGDKVGTCVQKLSGILLEENKQVESLVPFMVPFLRDPQFVGRNHLIQQLSETLLTPNVHHRIAIAGIGGAGKTQIALEFVYRQHELFPKKPIFWVYASNRERFEQSYTQIATLLDLPGRKEVTKDTLQLVERWLTRLRSGNWLMIVDNADDEDVFFGDSTDQNSVLFSYLPQCTNGSIIFTTRNKKIGRDLTGGTPLVEVDHMTLDEARQLLDKKLPQAELRADGSDELLEILDHLPLAISQAAAFMVRNNTDVPKFLEIFRDESDQLLSKEYRDLRNYDGKSNVVLVTWTISFKQIKDKDPQAADLLALMSFYDRQGIPKTLLHKEPTSNFAFYESMGTLIAFSLIHVSRRSEAYGMHRLVRLATKNWLKSSNNEQEMAESAMQSLSDNFPNAQPQNWKTCAVLLPHAQVLLEEQRHPRDSSRRRAALLYQTAKYLHHQEQNTIARQRCEEAISIYDTVYGKGSHAALVVLCFLAQIPGGLNFKAQEIEGLHRLLLKDCEQRFGHDALKTLSSRSSLAFSISTKGPEKKAEAELLIRSVIASTENSLGKEHGDYWTAYQNLGQVLYSGGKHEAAEKVGRHVLENRERLYGVKNPATLNTVGLLAEALKGQKRYEEAEQMARRAVEGKVEVLGKDHLQTWYSAKLLNKLLRLQGKEEESI